MNTTGFLQEGNYSVVCTAARGDTRFMFIFIFVLYVYVCASVRECVCVCFFFFFFLSAYLDEDKNVCLCARMMRSCTKDCRTTRLMDERWMMDR